MYKLSRSQRTGEMNNGVIRTADNAFIPFDPANTDYQEYLKWIAEGNVPLAAETNTPLPVGE